MSNILMMPSIGDTTRIISTGGGAMGKNTILILEDSKIIQDIYKLYLEESKDRYQTIYANNGKEGLKALKHNNVDIIICDMEMPQMGGIEFIKQIKKSELHSSIPIIIASGQNKNWVPEDIIKCTNSFIKKPFGPSDLLPLLHTLSKR